SGLCDETALRALLAQVIAGDYGDVRRLKGITMTTSGWVYFDVAGGEAHLRAYAPTGRESPRVMAIGPAIDAQRLDAAFQRCHAPTPSSTLEGPASTPVPSARHAPS
ncbi:MAG: GTP-binding protein, partial [Dehalococcoidia bacterium]|nr:GTP-binding protein [Dehalococcoidia bacterium]